MRYAFMGPMETIHLNAEGTQNYCDRYGEVRPKYPICVSMIPNKFMKNANQQFRIRLSRSQTIYNVSSDLGPIPTGWKQETEKDKAEVEIQKHYTNKKCNAYVPCTNMKTNTQLQGGCFGGKHVFYSAPGGSLQEKVRVGDQDT